MDKGIVIVTIDNKSHIEYEVEIPLNICVKDIYLALLKAFKVEENRNLTGYYIKTENPTCFLKGNDILKDYGITSGSKIILL